MPNWFARSRNNTCNTPRKSPVRRSTTCAAACTSRVRCILGVTSLFLCVVTMFLLYVGLILLSAYVFGAALLLLIGSLGVSIWEIQISVRALEIHLHDMEK